MTRHQYTANRNAITLLEVLIAIGILSVGLASVFALIPAAGHLSGKALNYDRSATLAENAINDFLTRGFHNPRTWIPSPVAMNPEWPFAEQSGLFGPPSSGLTQSWPQLAPNSVHCSVLIFDPLDSHSLLRDPTQPVDGNNLFSGGPPDLTYQPQWETPAQTHPVLMLNGDPYGATSNPNATVTSHPFQYEPSYQNGTSYGLRIIDDLFRLQDDLAYSLDGLDPNDSPQNIFAGGSTGQREFSGRYSCLFMLQRIGANWQPGQVAILTVVVFRDRDPRRSPVMLTADPLDGAGNPNPTWRIGHIASVHHPHPMANALADFRVKDVLKPGTLVYDAGTLSWWKAMYAPNSDDGTSLAAAVASADLIYSQNQCVWTAMGPNASATAPSVGPLFVFPDAVAVRHRQIVLASDDRWSE